MPGKLRDRMWLWGTVVNALAKDYGFPESRITIGEGLAEFSLSNAMMGGFLPPAEDEYAAVAHCDSLLWEMSFEDNFGFGRPLQPIVDLYEAHPDQMLGVLLDDFSSVEISKGAQPQLLADMRSRMPDGMQLWIVTYSMNLEIPNIAEYLQYADGISFWVWRADELSRLADDVGKCNEITGGKPMVVGQYMYDFGDGKRISAAEMDAQLEAGVALMRSGQCEGLCFLSSSIMDLGFEAVDYTREWIARRGSDKI